MNYRRNSKRDNKNTPSKQKLNRSLNRRPQNQRQQESNRAKLLLIEKRKARKRAVGIAILVLLIMLVTTIMIIVVMKQTKPKPRFVFVQEGIVEHKINADGLIYRDEDVVTAQVGGILKQLATQGSRVARGQEIAMILPLDQQEKIKELEKLEQDIIDLQMELISSGKVAGARAIYEETDAAVASIVNLLRADLARNDLTSLSGYSTSLEVLLNQRSGKLLAIDFYDARIDQLSNSKMQLELSMGLDKGTIYCETPGILSFTLDGLESELNIDKALSTTRGDFEKYSERAKSSPSYSDTVLADEPVLRVTNSLNQIILFWLTDQSADQFELGTYTDLTVANEGLVISDCRIVRSEKSNGGVLLAVETNRYLEWFSNRRLLEAEIVLSTTEGLRVPLVALVDYDQETELAQIMIVQQGTTQFKQVRLIDYDHQYAIIEPLNPDLDNIEVSTILVVNPEAVEEGQVIAD